ncbi:MAG: transglycosylase domain-containing protein [Actinomycetota bacterium]
MAKRTEPRLSRRPASPGAPSDDLWRPKPGGRSPSGPRDPDRPRPLFYIVMPFLFVLTILLCAGVIALMVAPAIIGADATVKGINERLRIEGSTFRRLPAPPQRSTIYASDGTTELATVYLTFNREIVPLEEIPKKVQNAVLAIEDRDFYEHRGVDAESVFRALIANMFSGRIVQGGSTITQQLVKTTLITKNQSPRAGAADDTYARKLQEAGLALRMEEKYTKKEILELYMNEVFLGNGVYGIGTASEFYFDRPPKKLSLGQAATLAGMIARPEDYDPLDHPKAARRRRNVVLQTMLAEGMTTQKEVAAARKKAVTVARGAGEAEDDKEPFFVTYLIREILDEGNDHYDVFGETADQRKRTLFQGGLDVVTTFDPKWERIAQQAAQRHMSPSRSFPDTAIATVDTETGAVRTLLSGKDYERDQVDLVTTGHPTGSSFKPFTLMAAFRQNIPPTKTYSGSSPMKLKAWATSNACGCVQNAEGGSQGTLSLKAATAASTNVIFAQLAEDVTPEAIVDAARDVGVESDLPAVESVTLGAGSTSPLEMASAYATWANEGVHCAPYAVTSVSRGEDAFFRNRPSCERVMPEEIANTITDALVGVINGGTGSAAALGSRPVAGKTGTSQENNNVWFVGYTKQLATAVWVGFPGNQKSMVGYFGGESVYGGTIAAPLWQEYMEKITGNLPVESLDTSTSIGPTRVPSVVGMAQGAALEVLDNARFRSVTTETVDSSLEIGTVVSMSPAGDTEGPTSTFVTLYVSSGEKPKGENKLLEVPYLLGANGQRARALLRRQGFKVKIEYVKVRQEERADIVLRQDPDTGELVEKKTKVFLTVGQLRGGDGD